LSPPSPPFPAVAVAAETAAAEAPVHNHIIRSTLCCGVARAVGEAGRGFDRELSLCCGCGDISRMLNQKLNQKLKRTGEANSSTSAPSK